MAQPYTYERRRHLAEPDWRRLPGYHRVSASEWNDATWQRRHTVRSVAQLKEVFGSLLPEDLAASIERDQIERATMPLAVTPQMLNTVAEHDLWDDPIRRYMLPAFLDRDAWPSHPLARRDSLHEAEMWAVEGLVHRYPTKVLVQLLATCPQYCGHCTRMDLVGSDVPGVRKRRFVLTQSDRYVAILEYLKSAKIVRDVTLSGGDIADVPIRRLESFVSSLLDIDAVRDVRFASKCISSLPQYFLQGEIIDAFARLIGKAKARGVDLSVHTHINHVNSVTPVVAKVSRQLLALGFRNVRNQGVLLRGINDSSNEILDLCFALVDEAGIEPYYFYMCEMIPNSEHWRVPLHEAQALQEAIMGYLPGFSTPRIVCDVPCIGKRWVHQAQSYDRVLGISSWTKSYAIPLEAAARAMPTRKYLYYDPIWSLPDDGRKFWTE